MGSHIHAYIINLDSAVARWEYTQANFACTGIPFSRVPGVNGRALEMPVAEYSETRYRLYHGKRTNRAEIGCYLSHIQCLKAFLESSHDYAVICEDDIAAKGDLTNVLAAAIEYGDTWDILRLCGYHNPHPVSYAQLPQGYSLAVTFTRLSGAGAYMMGRRVAEILIDKLLPMRVPFDHALDREWFYGLRAAAVMPLPIDQVDHGFDTQILATDDFKRPRLIRALTVLPYQAFNETARVGNRLWQLHRAKRLAQKKAA